MNAAPMTGLPQPVSSSRWQLLSGERFYIVVRWAMLVLLTVVGMLIAKQPLWPIDLRMPPILLLVWCFALVNLLSMAALFVSALSSLLNVAFIIDIIFISLFTYFGHDPRDLFYPLYLLPLVSAAFRFRPATSLLAGMMAACAYVLSYLLGRSSLDNIPPLQDAVSLVALVLRAVALIGIPWLTSGLAERWTTINRASVELAEQKKQNALTEANAYRYQMRSLYEVAYTLSTTLNYQSVLDVALAESRKLVPYSCGLVLLSSGRPDELYVAAALGVTDADMARHVQITNGRIGQALRTGDPCIIEDISREPELQAFSALMSCRSACLVPLRAALRTYGLMVIAGDRSSSFGQEQLGMIIALANYAIIALHNAQLVYDLRQERSKLLSKEEEVRHQLARDLHDGPAQSLAAITMNLEFIKRLLDRDPARVLPELEKLAALAKRTTHEVRTMLFELRPLALETQGLNVTLRQYLERFQGSGAQIVIEMGEIDASLDTKTEGTLFNIIQESINNALKYAQAEHIWVRVKQLATTLEITVQDDGRGFDLNKVLETYDKRGSFGLLNIEERTKLIGGTSELHSAPGQGTTVRVVVPFT